MSDYTALKRQDNETLYRACTQHLRSPRNRASENFCAAKIPHHWTQKNTFEYKVEMFSLQTNCRSKHSTPPWFHSLPVVSRQTLPSILSRVDFFGPLYIEDAKGQIEKHYGLIFTCLVTRYVHLEACPDLNTDTFLNAYRHFLSRGCQPTPKLSDNGKTFIGASEELKRSVKRLDNDKIYKAMAATNTTWKFNPPYGPHFGGIWQRMKFHAICRSK